MLITIISSMKFQKEIEEQYKRLSLENNIVFIPVTCSPEEGIDNHDNLVSLHLEKLKLSDKAFVLNVGGYIGDGAKDEIDFCKNNDIPVEYLENFKGGCSMGNPYMPFEMDKGDIIDTVIYKGTNRIQAKGCFDILTYKKEHEVPMLLMGTPYEAKILDIMTIQCENPFNHTTDYEVSFKGIVL